MAHTKKIGIAYDFDKNWVAGAYYLANIIKALRVLPTDKQPNITLLYSNDLGLDIIKAINYQKIEYYKYSNKLSIIKRILNKGCRILIGKDLFFQKISSEIASVIYPANLTTLRTSENYYWIPDFQEHYLPMFFSDDDINKRKKMQLQISKSKEAVVFSSLDAKKDFLRLYPNHVCKVYVLPFSSIVEVDYKKIEIGSLLKKFNINTRYFFAPNQFWQHKNHLLLLRAIFEMQKVINDFCVVFTGKEQDTRNSDHIAKIKEYVEINNLQKFAIFLGFIDRDDQLSLMSNSIAIIQPSIFEGWSTVVEDAKAVGSLLILSDIPVHREQISKNVILFDKENAHELCDVMISIYNNPPQYIPIVYEEEIIQFANKLISIF